MPVTTWPDKGHTRRRCIQDKHYTVRLGDTILSLPRTEQIFEELSKHPAIDYDLPRKNSLSGKVLKHVYQVLDTYKERTWPMIYKAGFTHDPLFRWGNSLYGYQKEKVSWDGMMVVFCSQDALAAAYVEAALIQRHIGDSPEYCEYFPCVNSTCIYIYIHMKVCCWVQHADQTHSIYIYIHTL